MGEFVRVERDEAIAIIRLDRPPMNALNAQVQDEIAAAAAEVDADAAVRAVVLFGGEQVFAAGADIKELAEATFAQVAADSRGLQAAFTAVARIGKPVVAAVTGYALGGGLELALCADFRVAGEGARVGQPEILLGIIPGAGGTQRLPRLIGPARAKDIVFTGRFVGAAEALRIGLVDKVVPDAEVYRVARDLVAQYATGPAVALRAAKQAIDAGLEADLDTAGGGPAILAPRAGSRADESDDRRRSSRPCRAGPAMTEPGDGLSLEEITAALRADSADVALYARVLTESLGDALPPGCVAVDRDRTMSDRMRGRPGQVTKVTVRLGEKVLTLSVQPGRPPAAEICREVRGVVLSRQPAGMQEWVDELARELAAHAKQNAHAAEVLRKLVAGS